jgi:hypothetical protein
VGKGEGKGWSIEYRLPSIEEIEDDPSFVDDVLEYANSPEGLLYSEVSDTVSDVLERADVDAKERQIIWEDGERLSITASAQRIGPSGLSAQLHRGACHRVAVRHERRFLWCRNLRCIRDEGSPLGIGR